MPLLPPKLQLRTANLANLVWFPWLLPPTWLSAALHWHNLGGLLAKFNNPQARESSRHALQQTSLPRCSVESGFLQTWLSTVLTQLLLASSTPFPRWAPEEGAHATGLVDARLLLADAACLDFAVKLAAACPCVRALVLLGSPGDYAGTSLAAVAVPVIFAGRVRCCPGGQESGGD